jgi:hypothetical protein
MNAVKDAVLERKTGNGFDLAREMQEAVGYMLSKPSRKLKSPNHSKELTYEGFAAISDATKGAYLKVING